MPKMTITVDLETKYKLQKLADKKNTSRAELIKDILEEYIHHCEMLGMKLAPEPDEIVLEERAWNKRM